MPNEYEVYLKMFCQRFEDSLKEIEKRNGFRSGFIFMFVRDDKTDCTDIASNLTIDTQKLILKEALRLLGEKGGK